MGNARSVIKRLRFPLDIMLLCVRWYIAYPLSLRNLEEMMQERGLFVDHSTIHRWIVKLVPVLEWRKPFANGSANEASVLSARAGDWTRRTSRVAARTGIGIARLISKETPSTSCSPPNAIVVRRGASSRAPSRTTAFPRSSTSTRAQERREQRRNQGLQ